MNTIIPLLTCLGALISAVTFDQWIVLIRRRGADTFTIGPRMWGGVVIDVLFLVLLFLSSWFLTVRYRPSRWLHVILIILALSIILYHPLMASGAGFLGVLLASRTNPLQSMLLDAVPGTYLSLQSTAIVLSAAYALFRATRR